MKAVAIKELKNQLSRYVREVSSGEVVLVTDRGRVVAELRRPSLGARANLFEQALEPLASEGMLVLGLPQDSRAYRKTRARIHRSTQELLDAERAES
jgi:antitoxin (DNA-binding transcriptional repressor) of toxin-antitoxin stability system